MRTGSIGFDRVAAPDDTTRGREALVPGFHIVSVREASNALEVSPADLIVLTLSSP